MEATIILIGCIVVIVIYAVTRFLVTYFINVGIFAVKTRQSKSKKYTYTFTPKNTKEREEIERVFGKYMKNINK